MSFNQIDSRVLVHNPNPLLAETICAVLERCGPFSTRTSNGELITVALAFRPDLILLDPGHLAMAPDALRADVARHLPQCEVLAYVAVGDNSLAMQCLAAGFVGAVSQSRSIEVLVDALNTAKLGGVYVDTCFAISAPKIDDCLVTVAGQAPQPLSPRERHVLEQVARGFSNKEIAGRLGLSPKTVETHRARATTKLGLRRKSEIVQHALRNAWLLPQPDTL